MDLSGGEVVVAENRERLTNSDRAPGPVGTADEQIDRLAPPGATCRRTRAARDRDRSDARRRTRSWSVCWRPRLTSWATSSLASERVTRPRSAASSRTSWIRSVVSTTSPSGFSTPFVTCSARLVRPPPTPPPLSLAAGARRPFLAPGFDVFDRADERGFLLEDRAPLAPPDPADGDLGAGMVCISPSRKLVRRVAERSGVRRR